MTDMIIQMILFELLLHLFGRLELDVDRFLRHRQHKIPAIIKILRRRKLVVTTIAIIIGADERLFESIGKEMIEKQHLSRVENLLSFQFLGHKSVGSFWNKWLISSTDALFGLASAHDYSILLSIDQ